MTRVKTDILLNGIRLEIHPSKLTKCGEIHISDDCTNAFLFCAFCCNEADANAKFFRTLAEFIDHIRWHRSDDLQYLQSPISPKNKTESLFEALENESTNNISAPSHETDDISDWIAPPEELFELNTISSFIEIDHTDPNETKNEDNPDNTDETIKNIVPQYIEEDELANMTEPPEITGEVLIELLDLLKKCPCAWHAKTAAVTNPLLIDGVYRLLQLHYNECAQQTKSLEYVRSLITQIKDCFLEEYKDLEYSVNDSLDCLPWYFSYLSFLLDNNSNELDKSVFKDFLCPICKQEQTSQEDLWVHIRKFHVESQKLNSNIIVDKRNEQRHKLLDYYPKEVVNKFIEIYRTQTRLWDKSNDEYYSRVLRRRSYDILLNVLRQHNVKAVRTDVISGINHLREQFACDRQKLLSKNNTEASGSLLYNKLKFIVHSGKKNSKQRPSPPMKTIPANFKKIVKNAKCPICTTAFMDHSSWLSHLQSAHTSEDYQSENGFFYCTICGWQNKTKELLIRHLRSKHTHNLQKCNDCNLGFRLLSMLVEHRAKIHDDYLPFKCEICAEGFANRSRLRKHSITHWTAEDLPHKCECCNAKFSDRKAFSLHTRRHRLNTIFQGETCDRNMPSLADLHQHSRKHLEDCQIKCDSCGRNFRSLLLLTEHRKERHSRVTFACANCEKVFRTKKALANHSEAHHFHNCDICGAKFFRKTSLRKHKRLKHVHIS